MPGEVVVQITTGAPVLRIELPESEATNLKQGESIRFLSEDSEEPRLAIIRQVYPAVTAGRVMADLDAGATGAMTGGGFPDGIRQITDPYFAGRREEALDAYQRWLPLINYENRQTGLATCKLLMQAGGVIRSAAVRHPLAAAHPATCQGLLELARRLDPLVLRWGR